MNNEDKIRNFQADLRKDAVVISYLTNELEIVKRRAKKTQIVIEELKVGKK